jgi:hypothetical protein
VGAPSIYELDNELLQRIEDISSLCDRIERAVDALIERHGSRSETVASARALQSSVLALKRELLQHYLEYRIADAARTPGCQNN